MRSHVCFFLSLTVTLLFACGAARLQQQTGETRQRGAKRADDLDDPDAHMPLERGKYRQKHAIVIGIDHYSDARFPELHHAVADAKAFEALLEDVFAFPRDQVRLLIEDQATKEGIDSLLGDWALDRDSIDERDLLVVFFAGHGLARDGARGYLVPVDGIFPKKASEWNGLIDMWRLQDLSQRIPARHTVFILDCCFSGVAIKRALDPKAREVNLHRARPVLTAGAAEQSVLDGGGSGHSVFTAALLDGLRGRADVDGDGAVAFDELFMFTRTRVESETNGRQTPVRSDFLDEGGVVVFRRPGIEPSHQTAAERIAALDLESKRLAKASTFYADLTDARDLRAEARELWPRRPARIPAMEKWLEQTKALLSRREAYQKQLTGMEQQAVLEKAEKQSLDLTAAAQEPWEKADRTLRSTFALTKELVALMRDLEVSSAEVRQSLEVARIVEAKTVLEMQETWEDAITEIALGSRYHGLEITPRVGLVPLGPDPQSELYEFWVWESGERPRRDSKSGRLLVDGKTGIVLVLLPGGETTVGSKPGRIMGVPYMDPDSSEDERPLHTVDLDPFLVSKYEITQGQWLRIMGENPSQFSTESGDPLAHPVESVSWEDGRTFLHRLELAYPTESQWEYAARAGTTNVFYSGDTYASLQGYANIMDRTWLEQGGNEDMFPTAEVEDGFRGHAPVGSFGPSRFGLYDMCGNVWEWCRDAYSLAAPRDGDGLRDADEKREGGTIRGGSFFSPANGARPANRFEYGRSGREGDLGLRPIMTLTTQQD